MWINERIRLIIDREKISDKAAAEWFGISAGRLSQKFKDGIWDSLSELQKISEKTGYTLDWIITGKGPEKETSNEQVLSVMQDPKVEYLQEVEVLREENKKLKQENEVLRSALREIGRGKVPQVQVMWVSKN